MVNIETTILIADDEERIRKVLQLNLQDKYKILLCKDGREALDQLEKNPVNLILTDLRMPGLSGMDILKFTRENLPFTPVIIITAHGTVENAVEAMKAGAYDYILKPIKISELEPLIEKALTYARLLTENRQLKERLKKYEEYSKILTINPRMQELMKIVRQVAPTHATVLIQGESGTGKQLFAEAIHNSSPQSESPFIEINCGAIPRELLESELFGHEKGAFTGAVKTKPGKFELASKGTIFLDEIGELPLDLQVKLLHVMENQRFTRVGGTRFIETQARIVTATNRDLQKEIENKNFREDLYYRLKVVVLQIPPLRKRKEDVPLLVSHFLKKYARLNPALKGEKMISSEAITRLKEHNWSGNVRELENVIQQAIIFSGEKEIQVDQLPHDIREMGSKVSFTKIELQREKQNKTKPIVEEIEINFLHRILTKSHGNVSKAAKESGYDRRQIQNLISKYNIDSSRFK